MRNFIPTIFTGILLGFTLMFISAFKTETFCYDNKCLWFEDLGKQKLYCIIVEDERIDILRFHDDIKVKGNYPDYYVGNGRDGYKKITEAEAHYLRLSVKN